VPKLTPAGTVTQSRPRRSPHAGAAFRLDTRRLHKSGDQKTGEKVAIFWNISRPCQLRSDCDLFPRRVAQTGDHIMPSRRAKGIPSLSERLAVWASGVREHATNCPPGPDRDALLKKAEQAHRARQLAAWSSPHSQR
jgi:hypothetical protein